MIINRLSVRTLIFTSYISESETDFHLENARPETALTHIGAKVCVATTDNIGLDFQPVAHQVFCHANLYLLNLTFIQPRILRVIIQFREGHYLRVTTRDFPIVGEQIAQLREETLASVYRAHISP